MWSWTTAHRVANLAAAQAHGDLGVDRGSYVDVYAALHAADILLMWRPMPRLFGAYLNEPGSRPGVIVNSQIPTAAQRQTAAHELGHHWLGHGSRIDPDLDLFDDAPRGGVGSTSDERVAEAFASWFLMPRPAVLGCLDLLGVQRPTSPLDAYRLAVLLGTGYQTTVRHLLNLRLLARSTAQSWLAVAPGRLKPKLDRNAPAPATRDRQVWLVDERFHEQTIRPEAGDRIVIRLTGGLAGRAEPPDCFTVLSRRDVVVGDEQWAARCQFQADETHGWELIVEVGPEAAGLETTIAVGSDENSGWHLRAQVAGPRLGLAQQWLE
jgi:IrrE N-terminal-like domain